MLCRKHDIYQTEVSPVVWELDISAQFLPQVFDRVKLFAEEINGRKVIATSSLSSLKLYLKIPSFFLRADKMPHWLRALATQAWDPWLGSTELT